MSRERGLPLAVPVVLASLILSTGPARALDTPAIDQIVTESLKAWQVPGAALAIIQNGRVVYLHGYGVRELGGKQPITPDTLFGIASLTKAFTTTAIAMLVDEGKLRWDDPVRKHVAFFRLADPLADENVTLRDLVCHRTGVSRHDLLWYRAPWSLEETVRRLGHVKVHHSFRSAYEYNNIMFLAAGFAVASASKCTWQSFVHQRIFTPLGMKGAVFTRSAVLRAPDHSSPHHWRADARMRVIPWYGDDHQIRASGSIKASVRDLAQWVRFQLGDGTFAGKRLLSARGLAETHTPQMVVRLEGPVRTAFAGATQVSYALGWFIHDYHGHQVWSHTGSTDGFRSCIVLVPKARLGIAFLMNADVGTSHASMHLAVVHRLLDHLLVRTPQDWDATYTYLARNERDQERARIKARAAQRRQGTHPSHPLEAYAGTYEEPAYGKATVAVEKGMLVMHWSNFPGRFEHFHFDTFTVHADRPVDGEQLVFDLGVNGDVAGMRFLGRSFRKQK